MKRNSGAGLLFCVVVSCCLSHAQTATTSLRGVVKDPAGALVPGASVTISDSATDKKLSETTNSTGLYQFVQILPARYLITVSANGFGDQSKTAELLVNQPATVDFVLSMQATAVTVDVSGSAQTLNTTDATIGNSVGNGTIEALPMEGRDPNSLLSLQPGVLFIGQKPNAADSRQGAVAGSRSDQGNVTLDGIDDNDQTNGFAFSGVLRSTLDSTEEFRVTTAVGTASAGRSSGAQVSLLTKAGTNKFHGALYEYYRPTNTVANDFFNKNNQLASGAPNVPQKYVLNTFGGSLGGPIRSNKLFFFFNYEGQRRAVDEIVEATVPTASFMAGILQYQYGDANATQTVTSSQVQALDAGCASQTFGGQPVCPWGPGSNPNVLAYYSGVPTATGSATGDGLNNGSIFFPSANPLTENTSIAKLDYDLNSRSHFFLRGNLQKDTTGGLANLPGQPPASFTDDNTKGITFGYTWTATPNIVNDLRYGYTRQGYQISGLGTGDYVQYRFLTQPTAQTRATVVHVPVNNIVDTLSWTKGSHTFAFGANWRGVQNQRGTDSNSFDTASTNPFWLGGNAPDPNKVLGLPAVGGGFGNSWEIAFASLIGTVPELINAYNYKVASPTTATLLADGTFINRDFRANEFEYYLQDTWQIRPNLTVTFGARHTLLQTPYEAKGQQVSPTVDTSNWFKERGYAASKGIVAESDLVFAPWGKANGKPAFWPKEKLNIAPRLSIVYAPDAKTSVRAGAGLYFDHFGQGLVNSFDQEGSFGLGTALENPASSYGYETAPRFTGPHDLPAIPLPSPVTTETFPYTPPALFGISWGIDNHVKTPYSESFDLSFQRELPGGFLFEQAYVGRIGRHLLQQVDLAEPVNFNDPQGGGDYFTAAKALSKLVDASGADPCVAVPKITYFEDVFSYMAGFNPATKNDGVTPNPCPTPGASATQAIYTYEWAPYRQSAGETTSLANLDFFCSDVTYTFNCPAQSRFWQSQFSSLYAWSTIGVSSYNALQFTLRHPSSHGLTLDVSYTLSKSIDMNSGTERNNELTFTPPGATTDNNFIGSAIQNSWQPRLNKAVSDFDTRHLLTTDWVYVLPVGRKKSYLANTSRLVDAVIGGWQFAGLNRWTSGLPYSFFEPGWSTNWELEGYGVSTASFKTRKHLVNGLPQIFDDPALVANGFKKGDPVRAPYPGEAGQRNGFRGDGYFDIDASLSKTWSLAETAKVKFAWEVYNVSNSSRFDVSPAGLNATLGSGSIAIGYYDASLTTYRRMQFGLRLDF
jgi:carboxypeptidase family protein